MLKKFSSSFILTILIATSTSIANSVTTNNMQTTTNHNVGPTPSSEKIEPIKKDIIEFQDVWARPSLSPNNNSAAYLVIINNSENDINLISASSLEVANNVELHQSFIDERGVSKMVAVDKLVVPAKSQIELKPGGTHIMLYDLKRPLKVGDKFKLTLRFDNAPAKEIDALVKTLQK